MNNKVNVFRVDNPLMKLYISSVGIGPYLFFGTVAGKEQYNQWSNHCTKHEPASNIYNSLGINTRKLHKVPTLPTERRPGPFEDMELRTTIINLYGKKKEYLYCFESIDQFKKWFHDPEELKFLAANYFTLSHYIVDAKSLTKGSAQAVFLAEGFLYLKTRYNILTLEPILPTYTPPKPI